MSHEKWHILLKSLNCAITEKQPEYIITGLPQNWHSSNAMLLKSGGGCSEKVAPLTLSGLGGDSEAWITKFTAAIQKPLSL